MQFFPPGTADDQLFAQAQQEAAVFVTTDRDFYHTVPLAFAQHHRAIIITLHRPNRGDLLRRLSDALIALGERNLNNTVWLVTDTRILSLQRP